MGGICVKKIISALFLLLFVLRIGLCDTAPAGDVLFAASSGEPGFLSADLLDVGPEGDAVFTGVPEAPTILDVALLTPEEETLAAFEERGCARESAMIAIYGDQMMITRYEWMTEDETRKLRAYIADGQTVGLGFLERGAPEDAAALAEALYERLTDAYGDAAQPLILPETWPEFALKDVLLAAWGEEDEPTLTLTYQVRRDKLVEIEARIGIAMGNPF